MPIISKHGLISRHAISRNGLMLSLLAVLMAGLSACGQTEIILPGERIAVIDTSTANILIVDDQAAGEGAGLPGAVLNTSFMTPGSSVSHRGGHFGAELPLQRAFSVRVGISADEGTDMAQPVVNENAVFTITPGGEITASSITDGAELWTADIDPSTDQSQVSISGGLGLIDGLLVAHAGKERLVALNAATGEEIWSMQAPHFLVGGPSMAAGFIIVTDINGRVYAFTQSNGEEVWNRIGSQGQTRITGAAYPAIVDNDLIVAGGDGELISLNLTDGSFNWGDTLVPTRLVTALDSIADITAHPVHDGGIVIAVTQSGIMVAYNARTGRLIWEQPLRSLTMPWLAGDTLFVSTSNNELLALRRSDGAVRWKTDLPGRYNANEPVVENALRHTAPVLVSGKVLVANHRGDMLVFDAETGSSEGDFSIGGSITTDLSIANGTVFALDRSGRLTAWR